MALQTRRRPRGTRGARRSWRSWWCTRGAGGSCEEKQDGGYFLESRVISINSLKSRVVRIHSLKSGVVSFYSLIQMSAGIRRRKLEQNGF
jgi:hypothetical protein